MVYLDIPYISTTRPSHWRRGLETCQTSNPKSASFLFWSKSTEKIFSWLDCYIILSHLRIWDYSVKLWNEVPWGPSLHWWRCGLQRGREIYPNSHSQPALEPGLNPLSAFLNLNFQTWTSPQADRRNIHCLKIWCVSSFFFSFYSYGFGFSSLVICSFGQQIFQWLL